MHGVLRYFMFFSLRLIPKIISVRKERDGWILKRNVGIQKGNYELLKFYTSLMPTLGLHGDRRATKSGFKTSVWQIGTIVTGKNYQQCALFFPYQQTVNLEFRAMYEIL